MSGDRQTPAQEQAAGTTGATAAAVTPPGKPAIRLSGRLARFLQTDLSSQLDPAVQATVLVAFLDTVGCILSGRQEPVTQKTAVWIRSRYLTRDEASWLLSGTRFSAAGAAMINAVSGHALDLDDVALTGHPSVVLVPVLLAESDRSGLRGGALVEAYVKGYEVWADLLKRFPAPLHDKGWHPTAVLGTLAATGALCAARRLPEEQTRNALGIAASLASGLVANFGSMTKPFHAGMAAEQGFAAVELAELGMTASQDALDGPTGLLTALSPHGTPDYDSPCAGPDSLTIRTVRPSVKKYPVCYAGHRVIDGVLALRAAHSPAVEDIERIDVQISATNAQVLKYPAPTTALEAKFSMQFACAAALAFGQVGMHQLVDESLQDSAVQHLMPRVHVEPIEAGCPLEPGFALHDRVRITLKGGQVLDSGPIRFALGHAQHPLSPEQIRAKVLDCAGPQDEALALHWINDLTERLRIA